MLPTDQCLDTADFARPRINDRLIMQLELVLLERAAQIAFNFVTGGCDCAHLRVKEAVPVAACRFGAIKGEIGHLEKLVTVGLILTGQSNADTCADRDFTAVNSEWLPNTLNDTLCQRCCRLARVGVAGGLNDREFIAPEPGENVSLTQKRLEARCNFSQQPVTGRMTHAVVPTCLNLSRSKSSTLNVSPRPRRRAPASSIF